MIDRTVPATLVGTAELAHLDEAWDAAVAASARHGITASIDRCAALVAGLLGGAGSGPDADERRRALAWRDDGALGEFDRAALLVAEQHVLDVTAVDPGALATLEVALGPDGVRELVEGLHVVDQRVRLTRALDALGAETVEGAAAAAGATATAVLDVEAPGAAGATASATPTRRALDRLAAAVVRRDRLDPVTTELVRLRCAEFHDCRT